MKVIDKITVLQQQIESLQEKYCEKCQEVDCDYCWAQADEMDEVEE